MLIALILACGDDDRSSTVDTAEVFRKGYDKGWEEAQLELEDLRVRVEALEGSAVQLEDLGELPELAEYIEVDEGAVAFVGANVYVLSGSGGTDEAVNGLGNLVIGYDEGDGDKSGSHNLVLGENNTYSSYAGVVAGRDNNLSGPYGAILSGEENGVNTSYGVVVTGKGNNANAYTSAILGGASNATKDDDDLNGRYAVILGSNSLQTTTSYDIAPL
jgi:hypothetical protein